MKRCILVLLLIIIITLIVACKSDKTEKDEKPFSLEANKDDDTDNKDAKEQIDDDMKNHIVNPIIELADEDGVRRKLSDAVGDTYSDDNYIYVTYRTDKPFDPSRPLLYGGIFRMCKDSGEVLRISNDSARSIMVRDGYVYYLNLHDNESFYRVRTDGTERTKIAELPSGTGTSAGYKDNYLYFSPGEASWSGSEPSAIGNTYVMDIETGEYKQILPFHTGGYMIHEPWIYFIPASKLRQVERGLLWRVSMDGTLEEIAEGIGFPRFIIDDEQLVYVKEHKKLVRLNLKTEEEETLFIFPKNMPVIEFTFKDGWMYWISAGKLYRGDKDIVEEVLVPVNPVFFISIEGDWIIYQESVGYDKAGLDYMDEFELYYKLHAMKIDGSEHVTIHPDFEY